MAVEQVDRQTILPCDDEAFIGLIREYPSLGAHEYAIKRLLAAHRERERERNAMIAEEQYAGHHAALGSTRAAHYEHAAKRIATAIRGGKSS